MTDDLVALTWAAPVHSGGKPVTGYQVQMRKKGQPDWKDVTYSRNNKAVIKDDLEVDDEVEFRVIPENEAGRGMPSPSSGLIKVREPPSEFQYFAND